MLMKLSPEEEEEEETIGGDEEPEMNERKLSQVEMESSRPAVSDIFWLSNKS